MTRPVKCPTCGKPTLFTTENPSRPFCSERCKLIDLGDWADGKYAIPSKANVDTASEPDSEEFDQTQTRKTAATGENPKTH